MKSKSFTLIELLVVISVIGLLSSIVLVNLDVGGKKQRARIAKSLSFSQSLQNVLGSEAVGIWTFDDCPGADAVPGTLKDSSGYGNNGSNNGSAVCKEDTPQKIIGQGSSKWALRFNGAGSNVSVPPSVSTASINTGMTIEAWVNVQSPTFTNGHFVRVNAAPTTGHFLGFYGNSGGSRYLCFEVRNVGDVGTYLCYTFTGLNTGTWHHYVGTVQAGKLQKLYIDGVLVASAGTPPTTIAQPGGLVIGGPDWDVGGQYFNGLIDEVRIYNQVLTIGEIQQHYAEGLENHQNFAIK